MKIENNSVVRFHYAVSEPGQPVLESSRDAGEPLSILIGQHNIIPGLESAMLGREAGETFAATVAPEQAYGERRDGLTQRVAKKYVPDGDRVRPGMQVMLQTSNGPRVVTVQKVGTTVVDVDLNHPMAGKTLTFDVEIIAVRAASEEELAHGHVHGEGGHAH